ncbi:hypothetical protein M422DRAFT_48140 [Sphaerobolus stellatus SS14]|uniref:Unplaced genomic scaffold SPHSTscaffold_53, whole genome shotgun sequence n=1 Tax=Sphaerobolus stellatus (strain SS14) TaxID=990650 RepID=A0A0C9UI53_SPHS4|nr:hypothetical protein M422DRAFT_48140 [Sphaerobolus stellatus SS14]
MYWTSCSTSKPWHGANMKLIFRALRNDMKRRIPLVRTLAIIPTVHPSRRSKTWTSSPSTPSISALLSIPRRPGLSLASPPSGPSPPPPTHPRPSNPESYKVQCAGKFASTFHRGYHAGLAKLGGDGDESEVGERKERETVALQRQPLQQRSQTLSPKKNARRPNNININNTDDLKIQTPEDCATTPDTFMSISHPIPSKPRLKSKLLK